MTDRIEELKALVEQLEGALKDAEHELEKAMRYGSEIAKHASSIPRIKAARAAAQKFREGR